MTGLSVWPPLDASRRVAVQSGGIPRIGPAGPLPAASRKFPRPASAKDGKSPGQAMNPATRAE